MYIFNEFYQFQNETVCLADCSRGEGGLGDRERLPWSTFVMLKIGDASVLAFDQPFCSNLNPSGGRESNSLFGLGSPSLDAVRLARVALAHTEPVAFVREKYTLALSYTLN